MKETHWVKKKRERENIKIEEALLRTIRIIYNENVQ